jgi:hypothetical protein
VMINFDSGDKRKSSNLFHPEEETFQIRLNRLRRRKLL